VVNNGIKRQHKPLNSKENTLQNLLYVSDYKYIEPNPGYSYLLKICVRQIDWKLWFVYLLSKCTRHLHIHLIFIFASFLEITKKVHNEIPYYIHKYAMEYCYRIDLVLIVSR